MLKKTALVIATVLGLSFLTAMYLNKTETN